MISYETKDAPFPTIKRRLVSAWLKQIITQYQKRVGDLTYIFCSDAELLQMNNTYLKHNYYTDIITFDYSEDDTVSGDVFISLDTVKSNSEKFHTDYSEELHRVMVHGILHLCGFRDKSPEEAKVMREKENDALKLYGF
jgi:rRNA maturation RNase YbeY